MILKLYFNRLTMTAPTPQSSFSFEKRGSEGESG